MENEALTMRRLRADDLFTMMRILSKIGVNDLRSVMPTKTAIQRVREGSESAESLGVTVALMIGGQAAGAPAGLQGGNLHPAGGFERQNARRNCRAGHGRVRRGSIHPDGERGFPRFFYAADEALGADEVKLFDMLYRRYSDPMALLTGMLRRGRLADFIQQCVRMYNEETEEKLLWEVWLHKCFDKGFGDFLNEYRTLAPVDAPDITAEDIRHSWNLLDGFTPPGEGRETT